MSKFKIGDRVSIKKEYSCMPIEGKVIKVEVYRGPIYDGIDYEVSIDGFANCFSDYQITFPDEHLEFLSKIEDRLS